jgi:PhnB protein
LDEGPWGTYLGTFRDKYGIEWMMEYDERKWKRC